MSNQALNIANILQNSTVGGPGLRDLIWVQGCSIGCKGCFNKHLWAYEPKYIINVQQLIVKFKSRVGKIEGITLLGGEPTEQAKGVAQLLEGVKDLGLTTVVYTGRTYEWHLKRNDPWVNKILDFTDILIDGPYVEEKYVPRLLWRGSSNQRIIFINPTYDKTILKQYEGDPNQEIHQFVNDSSEMTFKTGIG